jgi:ribosomal protein S27AE
MSDTDSEYDSDSSGEIVDKKATQREYNRKYYQQNKKKILKQVLQKEECPHCKRMVNHQNMRRHQLSSRCTSRSYVTKDDINELKELLKANSTK